MGLSHRRLLIPLTLALVIGAIAAEWSMKTGVYTLFRTSDVAAETVFAAIWGYVDFRFDINASSGNLYVGGPYMAYWPGGYVADINGTSYVFLAVEYNNTVYVYPLKWVDGARYDLADSVDVSNVTLPSGSKLVLLGNYTSISFKTVKINDGTYGISTSGITVKVVDPSDGSLHDLPSGSITLLGLWLDVNATSITVVK